MRFKKGSKVEFLCKKDVSFGTWRCAEIITDGGTTYRVRCEPTPGISNGKVVEGVPSTDIRPSPPRSMESAVNWEPGDVLEVLDDGSWKTATVLKVMPGEYCLIRILGSFEEFKVHLSKTRVRQTWKDDKWIVLGKAYGSHELAKCNNHVVDLISCEVPRDDDYDARIKLVDGKEGKHNHNHHQDSYIVSARSLKRASPFCSSFGAYPSKVRVIEDQTELRRQVVSRSLPSNSQGGHSDVGIERSNSARSFYLERSSGFSDSDDNADTDNMSVVDSCSVDSNRINEFPGDVLAGSRPVAVTDSDCSDAESFCGYRNEDEEEKEAFPPQDQGASRVHQLELQAYHSTLVAIHASGPLSWEREELLTNLRITLHISHDEHLLEVRNLIASGNPSSLLAYKR